MKRTGRILSVVLVLSMLLSLFTGFTYADRKFSVFVPKALSLTIDSNGTLHVPSGERARIYNASPDGAVIVKAINVEFKNGWYAENWTANFGSKPDNAKALGLQLRGDSMGLDGKFNTTNSRWVIEPDSFIDLEMQAKIAKQTTAKSETVAVICFTIDWAQTGVYSIKFVDAEGGTISDKSTLTTDENGIVPLLPIANPDIFYVFDHYEDESGRTVAAGDVINEDITLHPIYKLPGSTSNPVINFIDGSHGTVNDKTPVEAENGVVPPLPTVTPNDGYEQTGWEDENGNPVKPGDTIDHDVILHPVFEDKNQPEEPEPVKKPVITFEDGDNGTINDKTPIEAPDGTVPPLPSTTPDDGYVQTGWEDENGNPVKPGDPIDQDVKLHPVFEDTRQPEEPKKNPMISFEDGDNGTVNDKTPIEAPDGTVPPLPSTTPDDGYVQTGWEDENGNPVKPGDPIDQDVKLHPVFEDTRQPEEPEKSPVISFEDGNNGTVNDKTPIEAPNGIVPPLPTTTPDDGYVQTGWEDENGNPVKPGDPIDQDVKLHPVFEDTRQPEEPEKSPVISFEDGNNGTVNDKTPIEAPNGIVPPLPTTTPDDGYVQTGWEDKNGNPIKPGDPIEQDVTLHPVFEEKKPENPVIRFEDGDNGIVDDKTPIEAENGVVPSLPAATPNEGYEQTGWADENGSPVKPGDVIDHDITLHPVFEEKKPANPVIRFEDGTNGTVDDKTPIEAVEGIVPVLPGVSTNEGFEQTGWADENGNPVKPGDVIDHDITLHPVFEEKKPANPVIRFEDGTNGTVDDKTPIEAVEGIVPVLPGVSTNEGFEQTGWADENGNSVEPGDVIEHDITLHPVFSEVVNDNVVVSFAASEYNGTLVGNTSPITVKSGTKWSEIVTPETNEGLSASFMGWYLDDTELTDDFVITEDMTATANFMSWFSHNNDAHIAAFAKEYSDYRDGDVVVGFSEAYDKAGRPAVFTVPNEIDGVNIIAINSGTFADNTEITEISIEKGIKFLGDYAFRNCSNLITVNMPDTIKYIGNWCFESSGISGDIYLPDGILYFGPYCFDYCNNMTSISIPGSPTNVTDKHFIAGTSVRFCENLEVIEVREGCTQIYTAAFCGNPKLRAVILPKTLTEICQYVFGHDETDMDTSLTDVYFRGTRSQWESVAIAYYFGQGNAILKISFCPL